MDVNTGSAESNLRKRKVDRTREAIISTSLELFEQHGFEQVSVEMIMRSLDISTRTFYRYFPYKESVLFSIQINEVALENALRVRRPDESLIGCLVHALVMELEVYDPSRLARIYRLLQATPALQAKAFKLAWQDSNVAKQALCVALGMPDDEATVVAHAALDVFRQGIGRWLQASPNTSALQDECDQVLQFMTKAFAPTP